MEVRGQHQALPPGNQPLLPTKWKAGWASEPIRMHWTVVTVIHTSVTKIFKCTLIMTYTVLDYQSPLHSK